MAGFTGLSVAGFRSRAWVMGRGDWIRQNVAGLQRLMEPLAERLLGEHGPPGPTFARKALGAQVGAMLGYVARRVLGQFDVFLPPDDDGLIYFVGPNLIDVERRFGWPRATSACGSRSTRSPTGCSSRRRRGSAAYLGGMVDEYLETVSLDPHAADGATASRGRGGADGGAGPGGILRLLTPEQRADLRTDPGDDVAAGRPRLLS